MRFCESLAQNQKPEVPEFLDPPHNEQNYAAKYEAEYLFA
jgi:hypothetical protein